MLRGRKVLITGPTGFMGANLVRRFLKVGAEVYIFTRETSNKWRINDVLKDVNEHLVDLLDYEKLESLVLNIKPEIILHTAVYGGYPFQEDINKITRVNVVGTVNLVNACSKIEFAMFINTGSSSEYRLKNSAMSETDLLEPNSDYGAAKASATLLCQARAKSENLPIVTLRLFSPYGYYEEPTRLIPSTIIACLTKKNPKLSSPEPVRDFIFIEDVMEAYIKTSEASNVGAQIFNIGCGEQHSVGELVNMIIELTSNKVEPIWRSIPNPRVEPTCWIADISKARKLLNWQPKYCLEEGLHKVVKWFRKNIGLYDVKDR